MLDAVSVFLTNFADQAVILPLAAVVAVVLAARGQWQVAGAWVLMVGSVLGSLLLLKIAGYACGWVVPLLQPDQLALRSPSGHVGSAAAVYGAIGALVAAPGRAGGRIAGPAAAVALTVALLIGATRLQLGVHSVSEVVVAASIGTAGAIGFTWLIRQRPWAGSSVPLVLATALVLVLFHGQHLPAEDVIRSGAGDVVRCWITACRPDAP